MLARQWRVSFSPQLDVALTVGIVVQDFSNLPGCYAASVPRIIAGYWCVIQDGYSRGIEFILGLHP